MEEFSQLFCGVAHWHSEPWTLRISRCWSFQECQISGCYPVILWVCPNMAKSSWETLQVTLLSPLNCESKNTFLVITVAYCICRAKTSHQIRGCLFLVASLWHMNALFSHLWELWSPDLGSSFLLFCHPLCKSQNCIVLPGRHPWMRSGTCPGGKGRVLLIPASALSLTVISMFLSSPLLSSFSSAHFIPTSNHWLTSRRLTLGTQGWAVVTNGLKFLVYSSYGSLL